jgi:hypothetical protein
MARLKVFVFLLFLGGKQATPLPPRFFLGRYSSRVLSWNCVVVSEWLKHVFYVRNI